MTQQERIDLLEREGIIKNDIIDFPGADLHPKKFSNDTFEFHNCHIIANTITFENLRNDRLTIRFIDCIIDAKVIFRNCVIQGIYFEGTKSLKSLELERGYEKDNAFEVEQFQFIDKVDSNNFLNSNISFKNCHFKDEFSVYSIKQSSGVFELYQNDFGEQNSNIFRNFLFQNSTLSNIHFHDNIFNYYFSFVNCDFNRTYSFVKRASSFTKNKFDGVSFKDCLFRSIEGFTNCHFGASAYFENLKYIENSSLIFSDCIFDEYTSFNKSSIFYLLIERTTFKNIVSLEETSFKKIRLDLINFERTAYFDVKIQNVADCDRKTFRTIKQQLQKTENRIDYNRFRALELQAYYKELNWKTNFKDWFILAATKIVTGFDHSWRRALSFTIIAAGFFYSFFYISENYMQTFDFSQWQQFLSGYFRFLIVTDFYSPLADGRSYIDNTNTIGWFIFILGKIVIAFGIYEMIQAFRKFKA